MFNPPKLYNKNDNKKFLIQLKRVYYILFFNFSIVAIEKERKKNLPGTGIDPRSFTGGVTHRNHYAMPYYVNCPKKKDKSLIN